MPPAKIQLEFHNADNLTEDEKKKAETTGMLILAADFIGSGKVGRASSLTRISKIMLPILLSKTKSGNYIPLNPFSSSSVVIPILRLISLSDLNEFCSSPGNLNLDLLRKKLMDFSVEQAELPGGFSDNEVKIIQNLLAAPRTTRNDFNVIPIAQANDEVGSELARINDLVYDEKSLQKAIKDRFDIIETALKEESDLYNSKLTERTNYWKNEIKTFQNELTTELDSREKKYKEDVKALETGVQNEIKDNLNKFLQGIAKNIRKDEKDIEKLLQTLEAITSKAKSTDDVPEIERTIERLADATETFRASVGFARDQVRKSQGKERDLREMHSINVGGLKNQAEIDKRELREKYSGKEQERERELEQLQKDRDVAFSRYNKFRDLGPEWSKEITDGLSSKGSKLIPGSSLNLGQLSAEVELRIPLYLFQYRKNGETFTVAVPPVILPDNMKKPGKHSFFGERKSVYFDLVVPESKKLLAEWIESESRTREFSTLLQGIPNLLDNPAELRDIFFNSQSLMIDKLKVSKGDIKKSNDRLTDVWTTA